MRSASFFLLARTSERFKIPPSKYLNLTDPYEIYCLDEAAGYLLALIESGREPVYLREMNQAEKDQKHQSSLAGAWKRLRKKK